MSEAVSPLTNNCMKLFSPTVRKNVQEGAVKVMRHKPLKNSGLAVVLVLLALNAAVVSGCLYDDEDDTPAGHFISGRAVDTSYHGLEKVNIQISGIADRDGSSVVTRSARTSYDGMFRIDGLSDGTYTVTAYRSGFSFSPPTMDARIHGSGVTLQAFTGSYSGSGTIGENGFSVTGSVIDVSGHPVQGIPVAISGAYYSSRVITRENGFFLFPEVPAGSYTLAPGHDAFTFTPAYLSIMVSTYPLSLDPFIAAPVAPGEPPTYPAGSHAWYPLSPGATWTYKVVDTDPATGETYDTTLMRIVGDSVMLGGQWFWRIDESDGDVAAYERVSADTLYAVTSRFGGGMNIADSGASSDRFESAFVLPVIRFDAAPGREYEIFRHESSGTGSFFYSSWSAEYIGIEDADGIGETFPGCRRYEIRFGAFAAAGGGSSEGTTTTVVWFAENVGLVRLEQTTNSNGVETGRHVEHLMGYSIP